MNRNPERLDGESREDFFHRQLSERYAEYVQQERIAEQSLRAADFPCDGTHECEDDHGDEECDCDLDCTCLEPEEYRRDALAHATLAQAAALAMNTFALSLAHKI